MSKTPPRKVHLASHMIGSTKFASCGADYDFKGGIRGFYDTGCVAVLDPDELVWVPLEFQCQRCHKALATHCDGHGQEPDYETCDGWSATPLMRVAVETFMIAFARLCLDLVNLRADPEWRHRCHHNFGAGYVGCGGCNRLSYLNAPFMTLSTIGAGEDSLKEWLLCLRQESKLERAAIARLQREHDEHMARLQRGNRLL